MTQPQDKTRAEFEAWATASNVQLTKDWSGVDYHYPQARASWSAWQAACAQQSAQSQKDAQQDAK